MSKYLLVKGKAGMGNRLLVLVGAILYARLTGRRLYVDWSDRAYSHDRTNSFPRFFASPALADPATLFVSRSVAPAVWVGQLELSVDELMQKYESDVEADCKPRIRAKYSIDQARTDYPEDVLVRWAWSDELYRLRPHLGEPFAHLQRLSDEDLARRLARDELVLAEPIRKRVDEIWEREARGVTIGMHVRHTDRKNRYDHYPILIDEVRRQNPRATLFLATDSTAVEAAFRGRYDRVVVTEKWHPPAGMPLHRTRGCPDKVQIGIEALVDLWLLSRCEHLIYNSTSSFGLFAALLSSSSPENLIDTAPRTQLGVRRLKQWVKEFLV